MYRDAKSYRYTDSLLKISEKQLGELQWKIETMQVEEVEKKAEFERQMDFLRNQIAIYKDQIQAFEKLLRREKRKRFITGAVGVVATTAAVLLTLHK